MRKINYVSLCSGYGAECIALKRLRRDNPGFDFECLAWAEIFPPAVKAHDIIHPEYENRNLGDITKVNWGGGGIRKKDFLLYICYLLPLPVKV